MRKSKINAPKSKKHASTKKPYSSWELDMILLRRAVLIAVIEQMARLGYVSSDSVAHQMHATHTSELTLDRQQVAKLQARHDLEVMALDAEFQCPMPERPKHHHRRLSDDLNTDQ